MSKLIMACVLACACAQSVAAQAVGVERLRDVATVYVPEWGQTARAKALRAEVVKRLGDSGRVRLVGRREEADAVLELSVREVSKNVDKPMTLGEPTIKIGSEVIQFYVLVFELNARGGRRLWSGRIDPQNFRATPAGGAARPPARRAGRDLLKAIEKDRKAHGRRKGGDAHLPADVARVSQNRLR